MKNMYDSPEPSEPQEPSEERKESEQQTALLPREIFGQKELKPGKECKFRIVAIYDDEIEVEYVEHSEKKDDDKGEAMAEAEGAMDRMAMMNNEAA